MEILLLAQKANSSPMIMAMAMLGLLVLGSPCLSLAHHSQFCLQNCFCLHIEKLSSLVYVESYELSIATQKKLDDDR